MRALVVYESMFGCTQAIATAVAESLSASGAQVELVEVGQAPIDLAGVDLLVLGGPTHAFGMSRPGTRADAARQADGPVVSGRIGMREWIERLARPEATVRAAVFDTRVRPPRVPGSAARAADRRLRALGLLIVSAAESFWVSGTRGPLHDGEAERARMWAAGLVSSGLVSR